jgi:hypothetical protein
MIWTWQEIMSLAVVRSGLLGRGQVASASLQGDAMKMAGLILDEWDGKGLSLPDISVDVTFNTVAGQAKYLLGPGGSATVRPRKIIEVTLTYATAPVIKKPVAYMEFEDYSLIPIPTTQSMPFNYAIDQKWPQMEFYLYPCPDKAYPITIVSKLKWSDTITTPDVNPFTSADVPEGYVTALVDNIALRLAKTQRMETASLIADAESGRFTIAQIVMSQYRGRKDTNGIGVFSDAIIRAGMNP